MPLFAREWRRFTPTRVGKTHRRRGRVLLLIRFTPTRVGKTTVGSLIQCLFAVHPHAGGENDPGGRLGIEANRFTPTRVGKTASGHHHHTNRAVHPHAGGENVGADSKPL